MNRTATLSFVPRRPRVAAFAALAAVAVAATLAGVLLSGGTSAPAHRPARTLVAEAPDPLAAQSFPDPQGAASHAPAAAPDVAASHAVTTPSAPTLREVERQIAEMHRVDHALANRTAGALVDPLSGAFTPRNVLPLKIAQVVAGGNAITDFPYVYGGGHVSFVDRAYDCSGSVSYALAAASLISAPETSGQLEHWGVPGPGRFMTIFANAGHTFMNVDGVWFDTAGRAGPHSTRWLTAKPRLTGYAVRHYPGL